MPGSGNKRKRREKERERESAGGHAACSLRSHQGHMSKNNYRIVCASDFLQSTDGRPCSRTSLAYLLEAQPGTLPVLLVTSRTVGAFSAVCL